jgi:glycosyltransferase involved in cell wall biosynthesis
MTNLSSEQAVSYLAAGGRLAVMPSLLDASPYSVLECLHAGIPFVASDLPGIADLINTNDWPRVLVPSNDTVALAARLKQVLSMPVVLASAAEDPFLVAKKWVSLHVQTLQLRTTAVVSVRNDKPLVSVVLVHYNRHELLKQAIQSLDLQTYKNFEVILVDDGSTDPASLSYLRKLQKIWSRRGWQIILSENRYLGAARNLGAQAAMGKYILFMDDDDYAKPHQLEVFSFVAEHMQANIVTTGHDLLQSRDAPDSTTPVTYRYIPLGSASKVGLTENCFGDSNMFVRRSYFIASGGFTEDYGVGFEDYEYLAKATLSGEVIQVIADPLHWYRKLGESMSTQTDEPQNMLRFFRAYSNASSDYHPLMQAFLERVYREVDETSWFWSFSFFPFHHLL